MRKRKLFVRGFHKKLRTRRNYKDTLFVRLFHRKKDLLSLYNALNGSSYTNEDDLYINTLDDLIYVGVKNDISFIIGNHLNLYEHESTFCPNMPIRGLIYLAKLYKAYIDMNGLNIYGTKLLTLPKPQYVIFYNGTSEHEDREELRLSDAFGGDCSCLELIAVMYNINFGHNKELMAQCRILSDYSYFVSRVRSYHKIGYSLEESVDNACAECLEKGILHDFLSKNRSEVMDMFMVDYNPSLQREFDREEGYQDGMADGLKKGEHLKLIAQTRRKILKGKTLEQTSDELDETMETIKPVYDLIIKHPEKEDDDIYELFRQKQDTV